MTGEKELVETLKRCLKARGLTYARLATALKLSEASVKRLFSSGNFTIKRIERICQVLDMDLFELARLAHDETPAATGLSIDQENALAGDSRLLLVFHLLLAGWSIDSIVGQFELSRAQCIKLMLQLDRLQLIELSPKNEVRLRTTRNISWRRGGPIRRAYQAKVLNEFLAADFDRAAELLHFEAKELSSASREVICRKLKRVEQEFSELAAIDSSLDPGERESVGLVLGVRPYVLSVFSALKRKRQKQ